MKISIPTVASHFITFFLFAFNMTAQEINSSISNEFKITKIVGTGKTTGVIAKMYISNNTNTEITDEIGPFYIPAVEKYQPYIVPETVKVKIGPNENKIIDIIGYCTDIRRPPVASNSAMPPFTKWILPKIIYEDWTPDPGDGWKPILTRDSIKTQRQILGEYIASIPGTNTPLSHTIDQIRFPEEAAPILLKAIKNIISAVYELQPTGALNTPFSNNEDKERESIIQQTFWIFSAIINGDDYTKEDFTEQTVKQFEDQTGKSIKTTPTHVQQSVEKGIDDFWDSFTLVGVEAKILSKDPITVNENGIVFQPVISDSKSLDDNIKQLNEDFPPKMVIEDLIDNEDITDTIANRMKRCKCLELKGKIISDAGLNGETVNFTVNLNTNKENPTIDVNIPRINFDKSPPKDPKTFNLKLSDLELICNCESSTCDSISSKSNKFGDSNQYNVNVIENTVGIVINGEKNVHVEKTVNYDISTTIASKDFHLKLKVNSFCKGTNNCRSKYCKAFIVIKFKDE